MDRHLQGPRGSSSGVGTFTVLDWIGVVVVCKTVVLLALLPPRMAPAFLKMFADFGGDLPMLTRWLLGRGWLGPLAALAPAALVAVGVAAPRLSLGDRRRLLLAAFLLAGGALALFLLAMYLPIFEMAGSIKGP